MQAEQAMSKPITRPRVCFIPVGTISSEEMRQDLGAALKNIRELNADILEYKPIGKPLEAIEAGKKLKGENFDILVLFVLHGVTAILQKLVVENSGLPAVIWSLPVRYSLPSSGSGFGGLRDTNHRVKLVHGSPDDAAVRNEIYLIARVAFTVRRLRDSRIGAIGGITPVLVASYYNINVLQERFGIEIFRLPVADLMAQVELVTDDEVRRQLADLEERFAVRPKHEVMEKAAKVHIAIKKLYKEYALQAVALECHSELNIIFGINPCLGYFEDLTIGCEGDVVSVVAILMAQYLTGSVAFMADPYSVQSGVLTTVHCAAPSCLAAANEKVIIAEAQTPAVNKDRFTLAVVRPNIPPQKVTVLRLFGLDTDKLHFTTGEVISTNVESSQEVKIRLTGDPETFVRNICGNHYIVVPGDIRSELRELCEWMNIRAVEN